MESKVNLLQVEENGVYVNIEKSNFKIKTKDGVTEIFPCNANCAIDFEIDLDIYINAVKTITEDIKGIGTVIIIYLRSAHGDRSVWIFKDYFESKEKAKNEIEYILENQGKMYLKDGYTEENIQNEYISFDLLKSLILLMQERLSFDSDTVLYSPGILINEILVKNGITDDDSVRFLNYTVYLTMAIIKYWRYSAFIDVCGGLI